MQLRVTDRERASRLYALLGNALTGVDRPVFTLDPEFDLVVNTAGVIATNQNAFELLFRETDAVLAAIPEWVAGIAEHLPLARQRRRGPGSERSPTTAARPPRARPPRERRHRGRAGTHSGAGPAGGRAHLRRRACRRRSRSSDASLSPQRGLLRRRAHDHRLS